MRKKRWREKQPMRWYIMIPEGSMERKKSSGTWEGAAHQHAVWCLWRQCMVAWNMWGTFFLFLIFFFIFYLLFICIMHNNQWWFSWAFMVTIFFLLHSFLYCIDEWKTNKKKRRINKVINELDRQTDRRTDWTEPKSNGSSRLQLQPTISMHCFQNPTHFLIIQCIKRKLGCSMIHYKNFPSTRFGINQHREDTQEKNGWAFSAYYKPLGHKSQ